MNDHFNRLRFSLRNKVLWIKKNYIGQSLLFGFIYSDSIKQNTEKISPHSQTAYTWSIDSITSMTFSIPITDLKLENFINQCWWILQLLMWLQLISHIKRNRIEVWQTVSIYWIRLQYNKITVMGNKSETCFWLTYTSKKSLIPKSTVVYISTHFYNCSLNWFYFSV